MGARFALEHQIGISSLPDIRRYTGVIEVTSALLGAIVAGLLLMAPLDLGSTADGPLQIDLVVLNMPRAAAAGAVFAVVSAGLSIALGRRTAWVVAFGSAAVLFFDRVWNLDIAATGTLTTVNYIDSIFSGILLGALAVAIFGRRSAYPAFLVGALTGIALGDLTALPSMHSEKYSLIEWAAGTSPPLWMLFLAALALGLGIVVQRPEAAPDAASSDLPIGPILSALLLVTATSVSTEWFVRHAGTHLQMAGAAAITIVAASLAALLLPGRDGTLVLLAVAMTNVGSAIIAVPRPNWTAPIPVLAVVLGLYAGFRWAAPWAAVVGLAGLAVFAALTAGIAQRDALIPVIGITVASILLGYCFGAVTPKAAPTVVVALAALIVPPLTMALRGNSFGRVAYSPRWYRDPQGAVSAAPGWTALAITVGCGLAILALRHIRRPRGVVAPLAITRKPLPRA
ncbi:hypothetical protein AB0N05_23420 [Nocardia sp. NPDC051030]|uniref:hypothetical protein n=1 Tax=Nocardia sp. NPDC051030 TaxID=3155162 RepID=UPI00341E87E3